VKHSTPKLNIRQCIRLIIEDLGKIQVRGFKGYGASHPFTRRADKVQLGRLEIPKYSRDTSSAPVKLSRAFTSKTTASEG